MTGPDPKRAFAARLSDLDKWVRGPESAASKTNTRANPFTARLTIDVTAELRGRIKVAAFQRGITVAEMLRDLLSRQFPNDVEGAT